MAKLCTLFICCLLFEATTQAQNGIIPNFSKAQHITLSQMISDTLTVNDPRVLKMLNACEVGDYDVIFYFERECVVFEVLSFRMTCIKPVNGFTTWTQDERQVTSQQIDVLGKGHWYAYIPRVHCGYVFEYRVGASHVERIQYRLGCN